MYIVAAFLQIVDLLIYIFIYSFSMLELNNAEITEQIKKELQSVKKSLGKMDFKGAQILLSKLQ